jgi:hypothetical protein
MFLSKILNTDVSVKYFNIRYRKGLKYYTHEVTKFIREEGVQDRKAFVT